ncbi:MAG TPA: radical SAM protein [Syntrophales bacterium]|nr:radical SAM protein [Syntrophales bacterium]HRT71733.1 radical SAM protein [Syntrophales bacterium]
MVPEETKHFPLHSIYLYLSDRCNLRCRHCWVAPSDTQGPPARRNDVDVSFIKEAVVKAKALGLNTVKITGGEPFLRKDIIEIIEFLHLQELNVDIETNGTLLDGDLVRGIVRCGVRQVSVSLDSSEPAGHDLFRGVTGSHSAALSGLKLLIENGVTVQIIMTLFRDNLGEIDKMAALAAKVGASSLKINPIMPTGRGVNIFSDGKNIPTDELIRIERRVEEELAPKYEPLDIYFDLPVALRSLKRILEKPLSECHVLNIIGILADGTISLCGIGETETELNMGNIARDDIAEVWDNHPILSELRRTVPGRLAGVCGFCIFKFRCQGACRASAYALTGNLAAPFFLCTDAYEKGLFPPSRLMVKEDR